MTGLEKIVNQILEEANNLAAENKRAAEKQVEEILQDAKDEAAKASEEISKRSEAEVESYKERVKSSADLANRTAMLKAKQETIAAVLEKAYQQFCAKSDDEYFKTIKAMLEKFVLAQDGDIYFSQRDLARMPAGFETEIAELARAKGGSLTLAKETRALDGGFVLAYGGIEENCSFKALFDSKRDELQDQVQKILFS